MVKNMKKKIIKWLLRQPREPASAGAINYTMYFIITMSVLIMYCFARYRVNLIYLQRYVDNTLYSVESSILTYEYNTDPDKQLKENNREYIVYDVDDTAVYYTSDEIAAINQIGNKLSEIVKQSFALDNSHPTGGILKTMCGTKGDVYISNVRIIQPVYTKSFSRTVDPNDPTKYVFKINYTISNYVQYILNFDTNNNYIGYEPEKQIHSTADPFVLFKNDPLGNNECKGAAIEMCVNLSFTGINNIFYDIDSVGYDPSANTDGKTVFTSGGKPVYQRDGNVHYDTNTHRNVQYWESTDIVIAQNDDRNIIYR